MNVRPERLFAAIALLLLGLSPASSQQNRSQDLGDPHIRNFGPSEFNAPEATWDTVEDKHGVVYVGNETGVLEYDGSSWKRIPMNTYARSLARDQNSERIYVGSVGDFGYLKPDPKGQWQFFSLLPKVPVKDRDFGDVWTIHVTPEGVYFQSYNGLYRYVDDRSPITVLHPQQKGEQFIFTSAVRGKLYVHDTVYGFLRLEQGQLLPLPAFSQFKDSRRVILMPFGSDKMLVADRRDNRMQHALYLFDGSKIEPFSSEADKILIEHTVVIGRYLRDKTFALGTTGGGLVILDLNGQLMWQLKHQDGLAGNTVYGLRQGHDDGLWVNLSQGLSRVNLDPSISYFGKDLEGTPLSITRSRPGTLYVGLTIGGGNGVYRLQAAGDKIAHFSSVAGTENMQGSAMLSVKNGAPDHLILGSSNGLFEIVGNQAKAVIPQTFSVTFVLASKRDPKRIFIGLNDGLASVRFEGGQWKFEGRFKVRAGTRVKRIVEDANGRIWVGTEASGVIRVDAQRTDPSGVPVKNEEAEVRRFSHSDGEGLNVFELGGKLLVTSNDFVHLYRLDESSGAFQELAKDDPLESAQMNQDDRESMFGFQEDSKGNIWSYRGKDLVFLEKHGSTYIAKKGLVPHASEFGGLSVAYPDPESDGITWFGSPKGLLRYDALHARPQSQGINALIRKVTAEPEEISDSKQLIVHSGDADDQQELDLKPSYRKIRFEFAAPLSPDNSETEYQTKMDRLERDWSTPNKEDHREFTNLEYGKRTFHVRVNANGNPGPEAAYRFEIEYPWYRTWWAYGAYVLLFAIALVAAAILQRRFITARLRTEALEAETKALAEEKDLLAEFSKDNASLDFETVSIKLREHIKDFCDVAVFRAGQYDPDEQRLEYSLVMEGDERRAPFSVDTKDRTRMETWCIENRKPVLIRNARQEAPAYAGSEFTNGILVSYLCVPLISQGKVRGLVTIGSPREGAYNDYHLRLLQNLSAYTSIALDNANAYAQISLQAADLRRAYDTVESLSEIGRQITASLDLDTVLDRVYQYVRQFADASVFGVGLLIPEEHKLEYLIAVKKGERIEQFERDMLDPNQFAVWCVENRQPVVSNDVEQEFHRYIGTMDVGLAKAEENGRMLSPASIIYLPLINQDRVLGVITIQSYEKNAYSEYQVNLLKNLAAYTSIAIDNATAYRQLNEREREIQQRAAELATVNAVSQAASSKLEVQSLIQLVGEKVREVFNAQIAYVALHDRSAGLIRFPYGHGRAFPPVAVRRGIASRILFRGKPLLINQEGKRRSSIAGQPRSQTSIPSADLTGSQINAGVNSAMGVPIFAGGEIIGVIGVEVTDPQRRFTEADLRLLTTIASSVGVALHNARLFEEAAQARSAAEAADAAKSDFLSTVSHELRTPLTSVLGFAKIIKKRLSERLFPLVPREDTKIVQTIQQVGDNLDVVVSEGERLTKLIDEVLDLAKIEAGKLEWRMDSVDPAEIVQRALKATSALLENKPITLTAEITPDLPRFTGDRDRLIQVVINLISNAVKFTTEGSVTCRAQQVEDDVVISVADTGLGIAPADHPKVFEKFRQVGDTLTDKPKGTGLGLPICKQIVEHHGGRIWIDSEPGKGSTFSFSIPLKVERAPNRPVSLESLVRRLRDTVDANGGGNGKRQSILVVDDDPHIRELLRQEFEDAGHVVRLAADGREALNRVREEKPGLVVLDVMMPEMNGFDVAAVLKNDPLTMDIPIIMLSIVEDKERGHRLGIDRYLTKPVDTAVLFREVDALMEQGKSKKKVLIVDEDESTVRTLADVLQVRGYHVVETNGSNLLQQALSVKPDVIILNSVFSSKGEIMQTLRFENGLENVVFLIYE